MGGRKRRVRIGDYGTIPLPADFMRKHNLRGGDEVAVEDTGSGVLITLRIQEEPMHTQHDAPLFAKPSPAEIARRQALFARVMARRQEREIAPLTSTDLIQLARAEEGSTDDRGT